MERMRDCARLGAKECYGFPVSNSGLILPVREEHEAKNYCSPNTPYDQRDKRYYAAKYALLFKKFERAEMRRSIKKYDVCFSYEWDRLHKTRQYYEERFESTFEKN